MRTLVLVLCGVALLWPGFLLAETHTVRPDGTGDYPTIQAAIDAAMDGDTIELTDGTFTGEGNRDIDYLGKAIAVRSQSGNPDVCVIDCEGSAADPHRGFHFHSGDGPASVLEAVTITGGHHVEPGGGTVCAFSSPTLINSVIAGNVVSVPYGYCGGLLCYASSPTLEGCVFVENTADNWGGGMVCEESSPTLVDCTFADNWAGEVGGGLYGQNASSPTLEGCLFSGN
jgi:hypothetical protein